MLGHTCGFSIPNQASRACLALAARSPIAIGLGIQRPRPDIYYIYELGFCYVVVAVILG